MRQFLNLISTNKFIGFLFIGGFNTFMGLLVYSLLLWLGVNYMLSSSISFIFGVLEGYTLNSFLVFKVKPKFRSLLRFILVYCISLILNLAIMYILVEQLHIGKLIAQVITSLILAGISFYLIKIFVYRLKLSVL